MRPYTRSMSILPYVEADNNEAYTPELVPKEHQTLKIEVFLYDQFGY